MKSKKSFICLLALLMVMVITLMPGCSAKGDKPSVENKDAVEITWSINAVSDLVRDDFNAWLVEIKRKIKEQTGVTVNTEIVSWNDYLNKHLTAIASGNGPDIIQMGSTTYPVIMGAGGLIDLDPYLDKFGGKDAFYDSALFYGMWKGKIKALPWGGGGRSYYYRTDLYDKAGLKYPDRDWTWKDFENQTKTLTEKLGKPAFLTVGTSVDSAYYFWYTLEAENGHILDENYKKVLFNDEIGVKTVRKIVNLYKSGVMPATFYENGLGENMAAFVNGEVAVAVGADSWMVDLAKSPIAGKYGIVPPPKGETGKFTNLLIPSLLGVTSYSKHPEAAVAALQIILSKDEITKFNKFTGWLPFRKDSLQDPFFANDPLRAAFRYSIENGTTFFPQHPKSAAMRDSTVKYLQKIYSEVIKKGDVSDNYIKEQLDACAKEVEAMLK